MARPNTSRPETGAPFVAARQQPKEYAMFTDLATRLGVCYVGAILILTGVMQIAA